MKRLDPFSYEKIVFFTGAGMSRESGIPTYRGQGGVWKQYDYQDYARENNAFTVEINIEATDRSGLYDMTIREMAGAALGLKASPRLKSRYSDDGRAR